MEGPWQAWQVVEIRTHPDGSCTAHITTNDDGDTGYAGEHAEWNRRHKSLAEALAAYSGGSHIGVSGVEVTVLVNDVEVHRKEVLGAGHAL